MHARRIMRIAASLLLMSTAAHAQYYQTDFPPDEFRSRCARVFEQIGTTAVAVVQGMPATLRPSLTDRLRTSPTARS